MIRSFYIICVNCGTQTRAQLIWHEQKAITLICYTCGASETTKFDTDEPPLDVDEYDALTEVLMEKESKKKQN